MATLCVFLTTLVTCGGTDVLDVPVVPEVFPRSAAVYLSQDSLPSIDELARYDLIVIDSEWGHRRPRSWFDDLRRRAPGVLVLAYVNLVDRPTQLGTRDYYADRYSLWQFDGPTTSTFPVAWTARTAKGAPVSQYPGTTMANLAATTPIVGGRTYAAYAADWVADQVWSTGLWDGIFLDVWGDRVYGTDAASWDVTGGGADVPGDRIFGIGGPWERGVTSAEEILHARIPKAILIANGERTLTAGRLDGRAWESFADAAADRDPGADVQSYLAATAAGDHRRPGASMTINIRRSAAGSAEDFRAARFRFGVTLLQNGFWAPAGADYGQLGYYDEMDGGGIGRGYLGRPVVSDPTLQQLKSPFAGGIGEAVDQVYRRDFAAGVVLTNVGAAPRTVPLGGVFHRLRGKQDPTTNDGATVSTVVVPPHDGLVLLRGSGD